MTKRRPGLEERLRATEGARDDALRECNAHLKMIAELRAHNDILKHTVAGLVDKVSQENRYGALMTELSRAILVTNELCELLQGEDTRRGVNELLRELLERTPERKARR